MQTVHRRTMRELNEKTSSGTTGTIGRSADSEDDDDDDDWAECDSEAFDFVKQSGTEPTPAEPLIGKFYLILAMPCSNNPPIPFRLLKRHQVAV